jgi:hypothetical protein
MTTIETKAKTKISDGRAEILRALFDRAAEVTELTELERTGTHDKNGIFNTAAINYLGEAITGLARELSENIFREERPAEYAQQKAEREQALQKWRNDPENNWLWD